MPLFKKKESKKEEKEPEKTETIETNTKVEEPKQKLNPEVETALKNFTETWDGVFMPQTFGGVRPDATVCNLLLGIYAKLDRIAELLGKELE